MSERAKPYLLPAGATRRERAMLPFKLVADDSGGLISVCEFAQPGWSSGPVLHRHDAVDEGFFVTGVLHDREEWKINLAPDAPSLSADKLHPIIWDAAATIWETGEYELAAQAACVSLSAHIKTKASSHLNDRELVTQVFTAEPPTPSQSRLHLPGHSEDKNWRSRQQGLHLVAQGAFPGIRNIAAHSKAVWTEHEALEHLAVLSIVARWADETHLVSA
jgi:hypothetical protein